MISLPEVYRHVCAQVLFAILLAALGIAQAQMSFPDITQAAAAIERVFGTIDRKTTIDSSSDAGSLPCFCVAGRDMHGSADRNVQTSTCNGAGAHATTADDPSRCVA